MRSLATLSAFVCASAVAQTTPWQRADGLAGGYVACADDRAFHVRTHQLGLEIQVWNGTAWSETPPPALALPRRQPRTLQPPVATPDGRLLFAYTGRILAWDGWEWTSYQAPPGAKALWAPAANHVYAVGAHSITMLQPVDDRIAFVPYRAPTWISLSGIGGASPEELWIGSADGGLFRHREGQWESHPLGVREEIRSVHVADDTWALTSEGRLFRFDDEWREERDLPGQVAAIGGVTTHIVGSFGIARRTQGAWAVEDPLGGVAIEDASVCTTDHHVIASATAGTWVRERE
ncbi:MAG: hypothetical protein AAGE52_35645 [Myxococcota bacterium]